MRTFVARHTGGSAIINPKQGDRVETYPDKPAGDNLGTHTGVNGANTAGIPLSNGSAPAHEHHHSLIEVHPLDVATGEEPIPPEQRAVLDAEAPAIAKPVEDIAEDRSWLTHKLLNVRTIFSFALAIGIIAFIFTRLNINWADTWSTMLHANPWFFLTGFVVYYSAFWLRGARWKLLLRNVNVDREQVEDTSVNSLVEIIYLSWFVNCIVPAKLGDAYRSYLLKRNSKISFSSTIGTILAERVVDLIVLFGLLLASFTLIGKHLSDTKGFDLNLFMGFGAVMVVLLIAGLIVLRYFGHVVLRFLPKRFEEFFTRFQHGILQSFTRKGLPALLGFTVLIWLFEGGRLFFVTRSLDAHDVTLSAVIFIALLSSLITTIPATPGGAGLVEGAVTVSLGLFLKDHQLAFSIALLDRIINYWSLIVGGIVLYLISKRK